MTDVLYGRYVGAFIITYIVLTLLQGILYTAFSLDGNTGSNIVNVVIALISASWPASLFVRKEGRMPLGRERHGFALRCLAALLALTLIQIGTLYSFVLTGNEILAIKEKLHSVGWPSIAGITLLVLAIHYVVLWLGFWMFSKISFKKRQKDM